MKKRRFSRSVRILLFVPILVILLLAARGAPEQVQAGNETTFLPAGPRVPFLRVLGELNGYLQMGGEG